MKVILVEKVSTLGNVGEIVNVAPGYGRNYLLPKKLAVLADERNKNQLAAQEKKLAKKIAEQKALAEDTQKKLNGYKLDLVRKAGANGKLFGSITTTEISKLLSEQEIEVERRVLSVSKPIKELGSYEIAAKLFSGVEATFTVNVTMDPEQEKELKAKAEAAAKAKAERALKEQEAKKEETSEEATEA